jgi:hypothetical protein
VTGVLGERQPGDPQLPADLREALREWSASARAATRVGRAEEIELVYRHGLQLASRVADVLGRPVELVDPMTGAVEAVRVDAGVGPMPRPAPEPAGSTPWSTGLAVAAFAAVFVALADIELSRSFAEAFGLWWLPANLLVGLGLAPSMWLVRRMPFWRWPALGVAVGLGVAWLVLLLGLLA